MSIDDTPSPEKTASIGPSRPMSAQQYRRSSPSQQQAERAPAPHLTTVQRQQQPLALRQPPLIQPVQKPGRRCPSKPILITFVLLIILLAGAGVVELHPFDGVPGLFTMPAQTAGSFVQPPLNATQVN